MEDPYFDYRVGYKTKILPYKRDIRKEKKVACLNPALRRHKRKELLKLGACLVYTENSRLARATEGERGEGEEEAQKQITGASVISI